MSGSRTRANLLDPGGHHPSRRRPRRDVRARVHRSRIEQVRPQRAQAFDVDLARGERIAVAASVQVEAATWTIPGTPVDSIRLANSPCRPTSHS